MELVFSFRLCDQIALALSPLSLSLAIVPPARPPAKQKKKTKKIPPAPFCLSQALLLHIAT
jgi:hypothetical protein